MYRSGKIKPVPIMEFDVSEISQAYRFFSSKDRVGKVVISLENLNSIIKVRLFLFMCLFFLIS